MKENGEPMAAPLNMSSSFGDFNSNNSIQTPYDNYVPDKVPINVTVNNLSSERKMDWH